MRMMGMAAKRFMPFYESGWELWAAAVGRLLTAIPHGERRPSVGLVPAASHPSLGFDGAEKTLTTSYIPGSNLAMASACSRYGEATGSERIAW